MPRVNAIKRCIDKVAVDRSLAPAVGRLGDTGKNLQSSLVKAISAGVKAGGNETTVALQVLNKYLATNREDLKTLTDAKAKLAVPAPAPTPSDSPADATLKRSEPAATATEATVTLTSYRKDGKPALKDVTLTTESVETLIRQNEDWHTILKALVLCIKGK